MKDAWHFVKFFFCYSRANPREKFKIRLNFLKAFDTLREFSNTNMKCVPICMDEHSTQNWPLSYKP